MKVIMDREQMGKIWKWLSLVDNRPTHQKLEDGRLCFIYHRGDPYSIAEIRKKDGDEPETEEIYMGHFDPKYGLPQPKDLIKNENKINLSVENPLELLTKKAIELTIQFPYRP